MSWRRVNPTRENPTDEDLLLAARNGDREAFAQLVKKHQRRVAVTVKGMLGDTPEAEDVGQETFLRLFRSLKAFRGEAKIETYLTRIAINLSINELRKRRKFSFFSSMEAQPEDDHFHSEGGLEFHYERAESREAVQKAIALLKPKLRAVLVLRMLDGYSTAEAAGILKIPQGTVLSRLARAQKKLKEILSTFGWGEHHE